MEPAEIRVQVLAALGAVAPEIEPASLDDRVFLRQQVDLDSMDWLSFLRGVHQRCHLDIPESDYEQLRTLSDIVQYVCRRNADEQVIGHCAGISPAEGEDGSAATPPLRE